MSSNEQVGASDTDMSQGEQSAEYGVDWGATAEVWPSLSIKLEIAPWHWRIRWYHDDIEPCWTLSLGPFTVEWWANREWFPLERGAHIARYRAPGE